MILKWFPDLSPDDIRVTSSGATGEDLLLSPAASQAIPLVVECKNVERLNIWDALKQAKGHAEGTERSPAVIFRRNHSELHVALRLEDFLRFVGVVQV